SSTLPEKFGFTNARWVMAARLTLWRANEDACLQYSPSIEGGATRPERNYDGLDSKCPDRRGPDGPSRFGGAEILVVVGAGESRCSGQFAQHRSGSGCYK